MNDQNESVQSAKGWSTLIGDFSVLQLDKVIEELKRLRSEGSSEEEIAEHLKTHYRLIDGDSKKKIYRLSLGLTPRDDLTSEQIAGEVETDDPNGREIELKEADERFQPGTVIFLDQKRWVVIATKDRQLKLKSV
jgi:urease accessory protein UreE